MVAEAFGGGNPPSALFAGTRNGKSDEETCCLDEFDVVDHLGGDGTPRG